MVAFRKEYFNSFVIILGQISYGTIVGFPSPPGNGIHSDHRLEKSLLNTLCSSFAILGALLTVLFLKGFHNSRKKTLITIAWIGVLFWALNCLSKISVYWGIVVGALMGISLGCLSTIDPLYMVEVAPKGKQDFYGTLCQLGVPIGMIGFNVLAPTLSTMELYYIGASIDFLLAILALFIDESPAVITVAREEERSAAENIPKEALFQKKHANELVFGLVLMLFQQFSGINAILTNIVDLMTQTGMKMDGNYQAGITSSAQIISVCCGAVIVEKIGLKITWIISCVIVVASLLVFALNEKFHWSTVLPLVTIFLFQLGFGLGMGPIPFFVIPESFNACVRSKASATIVALSWLFAFVTIEIWPLMIKGIKIMGMFLFFSGVSLGALLFGVFCIKKGKRDDVIDDELRRFDSMESTYWTI